MSGFQSMAQVLQSPVTRKAWPFLGDRRVVQRSDDDARGGKGEAATREAATRSAPDGNHGGKFSGVNIHD